ncbi:MAG: hypothetical protein ACTSO6_10495 [Promethearchaeota archaeon]
MKKLSKILLGTFFLMILFSTITSFNVVAVSNPDETFEVPTNTYEKHIEANVATMFRFRARTQLRLNASVNLDVDFDCDALRIGDKDFAVEIEGTGDLQMNMTCTEEQAELGLLNGNTYQIRNRNRNQYQYQEGFVISLECNGTFTRARLSIGATNENSMGQWAYYDEATEEWVSVPTTVEGGYLTAEVTHFSTWTILIPDYTLAIVGFSIGGGVAALIIIASVFYIKKRK